MIMNREQERAIFAKANGSRIKPINFYKERDDNVIHQMTPKEFLDVTGSTGLVETNGSQHNSAIYSDLGGVHSLDPSFPSAISRNYIDGGDEEHFAEFHTKRIDGKPVRYPKKYYIKKDSEDNYTKDFHKYADEKALTKDGYWMQGLDEKDFIDEDTPPKIPENRLHPIFGTGDDTRKYSNHKDRKNVYSSDGVNQRPDKYDSNHEIFRGDELGSIEYLRRKLRHGHPIEIPLLRTDGLKIKQHEGRHRARAMFDEGITEMPVNFFQEKVHPKNLIPQRNSFKEKYPFGKREIPDTRYPIMSKR